MLRNSIYYFKESDKDKFLEKCIDTHMIEEHFIFRTEITDDIVASITKDSQLTAHKVYFKYDDEKKVKGFEIEHIPITDWIDNFAIFYDFPKAFRIRLFNVLPNKIFASIHGGEPTLLPDTE